MHVKQGLLATSALLAAFIAGSAQAQTQAADTSPTIGELVVTAQRREEALQDVPIAVSAFDQGMLERSKVDGGPNLVTVVPNVNFSKGNFTGYNFQIRGIGSKLTAASGDAGAGIHLNNAPLIANNLFETEFYDLERLEVLRGPQGTLYGRNATGGVVNLLTAKPTDSFEGNIRGEYGNYASIKLRGMLNVPINDQIAVRVAGNYLKRDGFGDNIVTGNDADDRDLYGVRATVSYEPTDRFRSWILWDHFEEEDNRSRIGKQFCSKDQGPVTVGGLPYSTNANTANIQRGLFSQGCLATSLYGDDVLGTVNSQATLGGLFGTLVGFQNGDAYLGKVQTPNIRDIESSFDPIYKSKTDIYEFNAAWDVTDSVTLNYLGAYTYFDLYTRQDYNRYLPTTTFNTAPNACNFFTLPCTPNPPASQVPAAAYPSIYGSLFPGGVINDPQNGRFNRFATSDISSAYANQWSHELRFETDFEGPVNFNVGGIYTRYQSETDYYVMFNTGTGFYQLRNFLSTGNPNCVGAAPCISVEAATDPTRIGHNYFDNFNNYRLLSTAVYGEVYWQIAEDLKLTAGIRYTEDKKRIENHSTSLGTPGIGPGPPLPGTPAYQKTTNKEPTGRIGLDWKPETGFTDETLVYGFYSRGYKAGGINPTFSPGVGLAPLGSTFEPELVDAFEIGTKNTMANGTLQVNLTGFYYDYQGYQISKIINRTALNENIDATVKGVEFESVWAPVEGLRLNAAVGYLDSKIKNGQSSIDTFNRTQGNAALIVVKSDTAANCVVPLANAQLALSVSNGVTQSPFTLLGICTAASAAGAGSNILNSGAIAAGTNAFGGLVSEGVPGDIGGNELPNSPHWTLALGAQYTWDVGDWATTLRGDFYHQSSSYARIYNSIADKIKGWDNLNMTITAKNDDMGLEVAAFVKNLTKEKAITDFYLTDDSSGLFRNVFYTEPRIYGVSIQKSF